MIPDCDIKAEGSEAPGSVEVQLLLLASCVNGTVCVVLTFNVLTQELQNGQHQKKGVRKSPSPGRTALPTGEAIRGLSSTWFACQKTQHNCSRQLSATAAKKSLRTSACKLQHAAHKRDSAVSIDTALRKHCLYVYAAVLLRTL